MLARVTRRHEPEPAVTVAATPRPRTVDPTCARDPHATAVAPDSTVLWRAHVGVRPSTLSRIETGQAPTRVSYLNVLLDLYGVRDSGQRALMTEMARRGQGTDWWACCADLLTPATCRYLGLEAAASRVRAYSALAIPGRLQTANYAAAAYRASRPDLTSSQVARLVALNARRRESLRRDGAQVHLIIDEAALSRPVAPAQVIKGQLRQLIAVAGATAVTIQVAGPTAARAVLSPSFTILAFADGAGAIGCCEGPGGQVIIATREGDVRAARTVFEALARAALSPARSAELIENLAPA